MTKDADLDIFLATAPGLEAALNAEVREKRFKGVQPAKGGVTVKGSWRDVWRANLEIRCASRITARIASFRAFHLAQLDKRARRVAWGDVLKSDVPFRVEATCRGSKIYHSGAAAQRVERAIRETLGAPSGEDAEVTIRVRLEDDLCTIGIDTSGELLHKRGFKEAVNKAPMRENLAAGFLRLCGFAGNEPVVDPMCGSGTFVIEAAEIAAGLQPGRARRFAFERLATFDEATWRKMRDATLPPRPAPRFHGSDRDPGAIRMSRANAQRADVADLTAFEVCDVAEIAPPPGPPGLVIVNPPYGDRIGDRNGVVALYRSLGHSLLSRFAGWRVGLVTTDPALAAATRLPFAASSSPVSHGGLRVLLFQTARLP